MKQFGHRGQLYTRRHWRCERCGRQGFVLIHRDDTSEKGRWRRQQSHDAQAARSRLNRCHGGNLLRWWTTSQELNAIEATPEDQP